MWETSEGVRTLEGAEAYLVRELVHYLLDQILVGIEINEPHRSDVPIFDALQPTQQLVMLSQVAQGLLSHHVEPIPLTAINEGAIYAVFCELLSLIEIEIDFEKFGESHDNTIRTAALEAWMQHHQWTASAAQTDGAGDDNAPSPTSLDVHHWAWFVEIIADQILWDRDFDLDGLVADIQPEKADQLKAYLGIERDYYSTVAPDVKDIDIQQISDKIRALVPASDSPTIDF